MELAGVCPILEPDLSGHGMCTQQLKEMLCFPPVLLLGHQIHFYAEVSCIASHSVAKACVLLSVPDISACPLVRS